MNRRKFLAGLALAPIAAKLPVPKAAALVVTPAQTVLCRSAYYTVEYRALAIIDSGLFRGEPDVEVQVLGDDGRWVAVDSHEGRAFIGDRKHPEP